MINYKKVFLYIFSLAAMAALLWIADLQEILAHLVAIDIKLLIPVALLQLLTISLINWQWRLASEAVGSALSWNKLIHINMIGTFVESISPALKTGAEITRVYYLKSHAGLSLTKAVSIVILQKAISLFAFVLLNLTGLAFFLAFYTDKSDNISFFIVNLIIIATAFLLAAFFVSSPKYASIFLNFIPFIPDRFKAKAESYFVPLHLTVSNLFKNTKLLSLMVVQAFAIWLLYAVKAYIIARSLDIGIGFAEVTVTTLFSYMIAMLPLFPGGLGSFEAAYSFMFVSMGFNVEGGIASALTLRLITFWFVFLISILYLGFHALKSNLWKPAYLSCLLKAQDNKGHKNEL